MTNKTPKTIIVLDYGSQYTQLITRRIRELGFFSQILPCDVSMDRIKAIHPGAIILSGGPASVYDEQSPGLPSGFLEYQKTTAVPVLGICYGMQLLSFKLGGKIKKAISREYGRTFIEKTPSSELFAGWEASARAQGEVHSRPHGVWMSHGDEIETLPQGFSLSAQTSGGTVAAIENKQSRIYGLQFHPEVTHTDGGTQVLSSFLTEIAGLSPDWTMHNVLEHQIKKIQDLVGPTDHVICGLSGGVDSTVAAVLVHQAIGDRLSCFFVDHGLLRYEEQARVMTLFKEQLHLPVECLDHSKRYLEKLKGVTDPEEKRKIIGAEFIKSFEMAAQSVASENGGELPKYLVQGTLYPDVIESSPGHKNSATIKSHHNVGGLPKNLRFKLIEPLRELFKDEVRELGRELGVPNDFLKRHPFPGPGLAVRVIGEVTPQNVAVLQQVDEIFIQALHKEGLYDQVWQAFAVFLPIRTVGVQGDGRTHDHVVALRAVQSSDGMTADWVPLSGDFLARVSAQICNQVSGVSRVVYDITSKPPSTIEWE